MRILSLDIGEKRVGVAFADTNSAHIAVPREMIPVDGNHFAAIAKNLRLERAELIVAGRPRNNSGAETRQTAFVDQFVADFRQYCADQQLASTPVVFQDESYTSVVAEERLKRGRAPLSRREREAGLIDSEAAALILQDFLERADLAQIIQRVTEEQNA